MKWHNAMLDSPRNLQYVLISVNGIYYDAVYDEASDSYTARRFQKISFDTRKHVIYWCPLTPPAESRIVTPRRLKTR